MPKKKSGFSSEVLREFECDFGTVKVPALAFLELSSISRGLFLTDVILKKAPVRVVTSQPISGGKHVILFVGDVASVEESHRAALEGADGTIVKEIFIPGVHEQLAPFVDSLWNFQEPMRSPAGESVGIVESNTLAGALLSADRALKMADVSLCRMRLGQGIGGKAYFVLTGRQEEVEAATEAARECLNGVESFCRVDIIARPQDEALVYM
ncbi:MAG: BMC domain-containing protein [Bdellovibrionota bacterium]